MYAFLRPIRSPTLLLIRMKAAETSASMAIADWTPLTVVFRSATTAEIETFISEVSTTRTNIAMDSSTPRRVPPENFCVAAAAVWSAMVDRYTRAGGAGPEVELSVQGDRRVDEGQV